MFLTGCKTAPIINIDSSPVTASGKITVDQVNKAIIEAGMSLGWVMKSKAPGHIIGTFDYISKHVAIVDIKYSTDTYSITYNDSVMLKYDGTNIHKIYNGWVTTLDKRIRIALNTI